jgi:glutamate synthase domain-containing protein 3
MVDLEPVRKKQDVAIVRDLITRHVEWTGSQRAKYILERWRDMIGRFVKVMPIDYRRSLQRLKDREQRDTDTTPATEEVFNA